VAVTRLERVLLRATAILDEMGARYAVVGGLAVSARAEPRLTRDCDLAVAVDDDPAAERCVHAFVARGWRLMASVEQVERGRLATARFRPPRVHMGDAVVDLLFASSGVEAEVVASAEPLRLTAAVELPTARIGHLLAMKVLARDDRRRPQDADDIRALLAVAKAEDVALAREALAEITHRGFHRGRDLGAAFEGALGGG
jgi:predicted nucleotidyltransferase